MYAKNENGYVVSVSENAFISLIASSLEAYAIDSKGTKTRSHKKFLETYGGLYGQHITMEDNRTLFRIEMALSDSTVWQQRYQVDYNKDAILLKKTLLSSYWPHLAYLGDFHSHPYTTQGEVKSLKGYYLSETDRLALDADWEFFKKVRYRLGLVVTVVAMKRASNKGFAWLSGGWNTIEFTMGNFRMYLSANCVYENDEGVFYTDNADPLVEIHVPSLMGFAGEHMPFGRFKENTFISS